MVFSLRSLTSDRSLAVSPLFPSLLSLSLSLPYLDLTLHLARLRMDHQGSWSGHGDQTETALEITEILENYNRRNEERVGMKAKVLFFGTRFLFVLSGLEAILISFFRRWSCASPVFEVMVFPSRDKRLVRRDAEGTRFISRQQRSGAPLCELAAATKRNSF